MKKKEALLVVACCWFDSSRPYGSCFWTVEKPHRRLIDGFQLENDESKSFSNKEKSFSNREESQI